MFSFNRFGSNKFVAQIKKVRTSNSNKINLQKRKYIVTFDLQITVSNGVQSQDLLGLPTPAVWQCCTMLDSQHSRWWLPVDWAKLFCNAHASSGILTWSTLWVAMIQFMQVRSASDYNFLLRFFVWILCNFVLNKLHNYIDKDFQLE